MYLSFVSLKSHLEKLTEGRRETKTVRLVKSNDTELGVGGGEENRLWSKVSTAAVVKLKVWFGT